MPHRRNSIPSDPAEVKWHVANIQPALRSVDCTMADESTTEGVEPIDLERAEGLFVAVRPADHDAIHLGGVAETAMNARIIA
jgi:hypothetical protein